MVLLMLARQSPVTDVFKIYAEFRITIALEDVQFYMRGPRREIGRVKFNEVCGAAGTDGEVSDCSCLQLKTKETKKQSAGTGFPNMCARWCLVVEQDDTELAGGSGNDLRTRKSRVQQTCAVSSESAELSRADKACTTEDTWMTQ